MVINTIIISIGFDFCNKNQYILQKLFKTDFPKNDLVIRFFGTSRTGLGISPADVEQGTKIKRLNRNIHCINLGIDGQSAGHSINMQSFFPVKTDLIIVEIYPERNPVAKSNTTNPDQRIEVSFTQMVKYYISKFFVLDKLINLIYVLRGRQYTWGVKTHLNGWEETNFFEDAQILERAKTDWVNFFNKQKVNMDSLSIYYAQFAALIKIFKAKTNSKIAFLRMPVCAEIDHLQDQIQKEFNCVEFLKNEFPDAQFIDSNKDPMLSRFHAIDGSHLDSKTARQFSFILGQMIKLPNR
jgi:hypothetical protein